MKKQFSYVFSGLVTALVFLMAGISCLQADSSRMVEEWDAKLGMVSSRMPLPASWERQPADAEYAFTGPGGLKISQVASGFFPFSQDPQMNQVMMSQGQTVRSPMSINEIIDTMLKPAAEEYDSRLVKQYELPGVAQAMQNFLIRLYAFMPVQRETRSYGVEWVAGDQTRAITVVTISIAYSAYSSYWSLQIQNMESSPAAFDENKQAWLNGLRNYRVDEKWLAIKNREDARRAQASNQQHQQRMAAIESSGRAALVAGKQNSDLLDQSYESYRRRQNMQDDGHARSVDSIHERQVLVNPNDGQSYETESYTNRHWLNSDGTYLGTDHVLYDPRTDIDMSGGEWVELEPAW